MSPQVQPPHAELFVHRAQQSSFEATLLMFGPSELPWPLVSALKLQPCICGAATATLASGATRSRRGIGHGILMTAVWYMWLSTRHHVTGCRRALALIAPRHLHARAARARCARHARLDFRIHVNSRAVIVLYSVLQNAFCIL